MTATYVTGDVFDCLAATPDGSVDLILTSPPFLALRSYLPADHPDKGKEIGQEPTPAGFVDTLLALSAEFRRVLAPHGSIAVELGDTYSSPGGTTDNREDSLGGNDFVDRRRGGGDGWPEAKSACLIPELYRVALAYGLNPITGDPSPAGRWRVRNTIRWCRPNPPVGALGDKFRPATSDMVIACLDTEGGRKRYFDLDAVRTENPRVNEDPGGYRMVGGKPAHDAGPRGQNPAGAPPLDWWEVSTEAYGGSHYATWPRKLLTRPIKTMAPNRVCTVCGEPSRRIVEIERTVDDEATPHGKSAGALHSGGPMTTKFESTRRELGWTDCGHDAWRPGIVLDPFAGSGTTLAVATGHGRDALGFDLDERNVELAAERIGPLLMSAITIDEYRAERRTA